MAVRYIPIRNALFFLHALAILSSVFRLVYRKLTHRLWWDDLWASVALVSEIILLTVYVLPQRYGLVQAGRLVVKSDDVRNFVRWTTLIVYTTVVWSARLTVSVTIVRLLPRGKTRILAKLVVAVFVIFWLVLVIQKLFICGRVTKAVLSCPIPHATGILELVLDLLGDIWLIGAPIHMVAQMNSLPRSHVRLITGIFAAGVLTTVTSIVHCSYIFQNNYLLTGLSAHFEATISVIVCNLLVLVTYLYRVFGGSPGGEDSTDASNKPSPNTLNDFTTVASSSQPPTAILLTDISSTSGSSRSNLYSSGLSSQLDSQDLRSTGHNSMLDTPGRGSEQKNIKLYMGMRIEETERKRGVELEGV